MRRGKRCCCFRNTDGNGEKQRRRERGREREREREKFRALTAKGIGRKGKVGEEEEAARRSEGGVRKKKREEKKANTLQPAVHPPLVTISHQPSPVKFIRREDEPYGKKTPARSETRRA